MVHGSKFGERELKRVQDLLDFFFGQLLQEFFSPFQNSSYFALTTT